jgi:flagellar hook-basal body complex protein FliE
MAVGPVRSLGAVDPRQVYQQNAASQPRAGFAEQLGMAVDEVNRLQLARDEKIEAMVSGEVADVHEVMIAAEEAQLAFELMLEVRNKLLEAYQEVMRMHV